jgi:hypothetical protein
MHMARSATKKMLLPKIPKNFPMQDLQDMVLFVCLLLLLSVSVCMCVCVYVCVCVCVCMNMREG